MEKPFWESKKFWVSLIGAAVPAANAAFGWGLTVGEVSTILLPIVGYVVGQGFADNGKNAVAPAKK